MILEVPRAAPATSNPALEGFDEMLLYVERECTDEEGKDASPQNYERLGITKDAARAFWQLFEAFREAALRRHGKVYVYPVAPAEDLRENPLVRGAEIDWIYNGSRLDRYTFQRGVPVIEVDQDLWRDAVARLSDQNSVPVYIRFALDAIFFAQHDPPRGIIMACAAWETALRCYLANSSTKTSKPRRALPKDGGIPRLWGLAKATRGGSLFYDTIDAASGLEREVLKTYRRRMDELPKLRNKLLHEGETGLPEGAAVDSALAVLDAIEWLFVSSNP